MKKLLLIVLFILNSVFTFSFNKDKLGIRYVYDCQKCNSSTFQKEECKKHKGYSYKIHLLENLKVLLDEFNKNEPRALHNYSKKKNVYLMRAKIKSLSSGAFDDELIINFEDGTMVYINKSDEEKYFELNKGDFVSLYADSPSMSFGDLKFKNGYIISEYTYQNVKKFLETY